MRTLRRSFVALLVFALLAVGGPWAYVVLRSMGYIKSNPNELPVMDVALVMGAATINDSQDPSPYLKARLDRALELWEAGRISVFIVSGSTSDNETAVMENYLVAHGVNRADIVQDGHGNDSYSSCLRATKAYGVRQLIVVSQSYHVPRTVATCRTLGINAWGYGDDSVPKDGTWRRYERRELGANMKAGVDVLLRRDVDAWAYDDAVSEALARHG
ncbi:hypothetical protein HMPREF1531_00513 [Propionibacterium sp. oral taxon 192 str. F0372]|uniref:SanA/YdcF family protein n=1 Tax=Propionibacterium sp. oral taxon 192 TaxID=671222 RepID=UPI00035273B6|nr:ElyC/SanA/YdcF family protein [Propionibacterium sp. oral taxon 192]EPH06612.1 hypothetical protein HMPREF1531_00513 [Propionibacterium sp. oral taxon 192 str. F0372]